MKKMFVIILSFTSLASMSQEPPLSVQQQVENLADITENESQEDDQYLLQLDHFKKHPLNINTASAEELKQLRMLTDLQADHLVRYRDLLGLFIDIHELQSVPYWDISTIKRILPYLYAGPATGMKENFLSRFKGEQSLLLRLTRVLEASKGYDSSSNGYLGDRNHVLFRYRYQYKDLLYFGLVGDKDAGEQFLKGAQSKGFDFYSFHFFARRLGVIKAIALGDYSINLGQGLIQWQSMGFGKSAEVLSIKRQSPVLMPYRSAGEIFFERGMALTLEKGSWEATAFISKKKISGNREGDSAKSFSSFLTSGYYRNLNEQSEKNRISHVLAGANLSYHNRSLKLGFNLVANHFGLSLEKKDEPYNLFAVSGKRFFNTGIDFSYTYNNVHLFGEVATDRNLTTALVTGALVCADPKIDISLLYRRIPSTFQSLAGSAFTETSQPVNESGFYTGISIKPSNAWHLNAYADFYSFPWIRYRVNAPTHGQDYLLQWNYHPNRQFEFHLRYRFENKAINEGSTEVIDFPSAYVRRSFRMHMAGTLSTGWTFKSRVELSWYGHQDEVGEQGFMGFFETGYKPATFWNANVRIQYFETGSYDTRIYAYESDVLYSFSTPAFFGTGVRYYLNIGIRAGKKMDLWMKWAQFLYDKKGIGSGSDLIDGRTKTEVKFQLLYVF
jgi:hypothetical protein